MRYKLILQYDGSGYHGWQRQKNQPLTVQQTVETALERVTGHAVRVEGSGRTDEGVHALGQSAHFDTDKELAPERYLAAVNYYLPPDIRVINCETADSAFHARKSAKSKTYIYKIYDSPVENPLLLRRAYCTLRYDRLNDAAMNKAAGYLVGRHDFSAFMSAGSSAKTFTRTVYAAAVDREGDTVTFTVTGDGFLYNMVRIITGSLVKIGKGLPPENIKTALESRDRALAPDIAPACGLYLLKVDY